MNAYPKDPRGGVPGCQDGRGHGRGGPNSEAVFRACVEQILAPAPQPGRVVVLDDLRAYKGERAREPVEAIGRAPMALATEDANGWSSHRGHEARGS